MMMVLTQQNLVHAMPSFGRAQRLLVSGCVFWSNDQLQRQATLAQTSMLSSTREPQTMLLLSQQLSCGDVRMCT